MYNYVIIVNESHHNVKVTWVVDCVKVCKTYFMCILPVSFRYEQMIVVKKLSSLQRRLRTTSHN